MGSVVCLYSLPYRVCLFFCSLTHPLSANNLAKTVLKRFAGATLQYGIPTRVRADHGSENVLVKDFINSYHRARNPENTTVKYFIAGKSVHNQRIERYWRELNRLLHSKYIGIFTFLESEYGLSRDSNTNLACLHIIYMHRIQTDLDKKVSSWNNHGLSTEENEAPITLFHDPRFVLRLPDTETVHLLVQQASGNIQLLAGPETVSVNEPRIPLPDDQIQALKEHFLGLPDDKNHGITHYVALRETVNLLLNDM